MSEESQPADSALDAPKDGSGQEAQSGDPQASGVRSVRTESSEPVSSENHDQFTSKSLQKPSRINRPSLIEFVSKKRTNPNSYDSLVSPDHHSPLFGSPSAPRPRLKRNSSGKTCRIEDKLVQLQRKSYEKLDAQRKLKEEDLLRECTFQPNQATSSTPRKFEEFYAEMLKRDKAKKRRLKALKECSEPSEFRFTPTLCERSVKIMQQKNSGSMQLLSNGATPISQYTIEAVRESELTPCTFTPKVNLHSEQLLRPASVTTLLYNDALRRMHKTAPEVPSMTPRPLVRSVDLLATSFLRDFEQCQKILDPEQTGSLSYSVFGALLKAMRLVQEPMPNEEGMLVIELWKTLGGEEQASTWTNVKSLLLAVMGFHQSWMSDSESFSLHRHQVQRLHLKYYRLYKNRGARQKEQVLVKQSPGKKTAFKAVERLLEHAKKKESRIRLMQEEKEKQEMMECTFTPQVSQKAREFLQSLVTPRLLSHSVASPCTLTPQPTKSLFSAFSNLITCGKSQTNSPIVSAASSCMPSDIEQQANEEFSGDRSPLLPDLDSSSEISKQAPSPAKPSGKPVIVFLGGQTSPFAST